MVDKVYSGRVRSKERERECIAAAAANFPSDKYTTFSKRDPGYRKSQHKVPKWTRVSLTMRTAFRSSLTPLQLTLRENPKGF